MTPLIQRQFEVLREKFPAAELLPMASGAALVHIPAVRLPSGWNRSATSIWFVAPVGYPAAKPDCFWADSGLCLQNGAAPNATNQTPIPERGGAALTWFSWHVGKWDPIRDSLLKYTQVILNRLDPAR